MYSVNFIFRNSSVTQGFVFKMRSKADELLKKASLVDTGHLEVDDDFGCQASIDMAEIVGVVKNDVAREYEKASEFRKLEQQSYGNKMGTTGFMGPAQGIIGNQWDGRKS